MRGPASRGAGYLTAVARTFFFYLYTQGFASGFSQSARKTGIKGTDSRKYRVLIWPMLIRRAHIHWNLQLHEIYPVRHLWNGRTHGLLLRDKTQTAA